MLAPYCLMLTPYCLLIAAYCLLRTAYCLLMHFPDPLRNFSRNIFSRNIFLTKKSVRVAKRDRIGSETARILNEIIPKRYTFYASTVRGRSAHTRGRRIEFQFLAVLPKSPSLGGRNSPASPHAHRGGMGAARVRRAAAPRPPHGARAHSLLAAAPACLLFDCVY